MQITVTMDLTEANLKKLSAFLNEINEEPKKTETTKASNKKAETPKPVQVETPKPVPVEQVEEPKTEAPKITKTDLRAVALKLSKNGKAEELAKIFEEFGASNLSSIKEADYPAVMERLVAVNA